MDDSSKVFKAFISYRYAGIDTFVADELHKQLEKYKVPKALRRKLKDPREYTLGRIFQDKLNLSASSDLWNSIEASLLDSEYFILICSPRITKESWCYREITTYLKKNGKKKIICVLSEGEPEDVIPKILWEDGDIPLAVDVRGTDKRTIKKNIQFAIPKIVAPMMNLPLDELINRTGEEMFQSRLKVMAAITLFFMLFGGSTYHQMMDIREQKELLQEQVQRNMFQQQKIQTSLSMNMLEDGETKKAIEELLNVMPTDLNNPEFPLYYGCFNVLTKALRLYDSGSKYVPQKYEYEDIELYVNTNLMEINEDLLLVFNDENDKWEYDSFEVFDIETGIVLHKFDYYLGDVYEDSIFYDGRVDQYICAEDGCLFYSDYAGVHCYSMDDFSRKWDTPLNGMHGIKKIGHYIYAYCRDEIVLISADDGRVITTKKYGGDKYNYELDEDGDYNSGFSEENGYFFNIVELYEYDNKIYALSESDALEKYGYISGYIYDEKYGTYYLDSDAYEEYDSDFDPESEKYKGKSNKISSWFYQINGYDLEIVDAVELDGIAYLGVCDNDKGTAYVANEYFDDYEEISGVTSINLDEMEIEWKNDDVSNEISIICYTDETNFSEYIYVAGAMDKSLSTISVKDGSMVAHNILDENIKQLYFKNSSNGTILEACLDNGSIIENQYPGDVFFKSNVINRVNDKKRANVMRLGSDRYLEMLSDCYILYTKKDLSEKEVFYELGVEYEKYSADKKTFDYDEMTIQNAGWELVADDKNRKISVYRNGELAKVLDIGNKSIDGMMIADSGKLAFYRYAGTRVNYIYLDENNYDNIEAYDFLNIELSYIQEFENFIIVSYFTDDFYENQQLYIFDEETHQMELYATMDDFVYYTPDEHKICLGNDNGYMMVPLYTNEQIVEEARKWLENSSTRMD